MISKNRGPGRPATGKGTLIGVRLDDAMLAALDGFRGADPRGLNRPQAIRAIMKMSLGSPAADKERRVQELLERGRQLQAKKAGNVAPQ